MFYTNSTKLKSFQLLEKSLHRIWTAGNFPFVFFDDIDEFRSIYMQPYTVSDHHVEDLNTTVTLTVVGQAQNLYTLRLFKMLQEALNFRYQVFMFNHLQAAKIYTVFNKNSILLIDTAGASSLTPLPYRSFSENLYFRTDGHLYSSTFFLQIFQLQLWIYIIVILVIVYGCFVIAARVLKHNTIKLIDFVSLILGNSICVGAMTMSNRILFLSVLLLITIVYAAFGAFLDVFLAITRINLPFRDIIELIRNPDYTLCFIDNYHFSDNIVYMMLQNNGKVMLNSEYCPASDIMEWHWKNDMEFKCELDEMAFIFAERVSLYERFLIQRCNLAKFPGKYFRTQSTLLISLEFTFKEALNRKIIMAITSGNIDYLINTAWFNEYPFKDPFEKGHLQIEFDHCKLILVLWLTGCLVSFIVLAVEITYASRFMRLNVTT